MTGIEGGRTGEDEGLVGGVEGGGDFHGVEDAMVVVFGGRGEDDFAIGCDFQLHITVAVVGEGDAAQFRAAVFEHRYLCFRFDAFVDSQVGDFVAGEADMVAFGHHIERCIGVAPETVVAEVADVEVGAVMVGGDLTIAVEKDVAVAREATAAVVEEDGILAVADEADFGHIGYGVEIACVAFSLHLGVLVALVLRHLEVDIRFHLCFLFQQSLHTPHGRLLHEVVLEAVVGEIICEGGENHTLVVGIVGFDSHVVLFVIALEKSELIVHVKIPEVLDVFVYRAVVDRDGHQRAIGRHDDTVGCCVLELQIGDSEGMVLVVLSVVELVVCSLRDAPGLGVEGSLGADGETIGLVHQRVLVGGEENQRHEIFEQCPVPRCHSLVAAILHQRLVEAEPVLVGGVALRDGEEGGEAGFGGEVVVVIGQEGVALRVVADGEDIELGVVEFGEIGLVNQPLHLRF